MLSGRQADWEVENSDVSLLVLEGPSGWGKTTLLCKLILDTVKVYIVV